MTLLTTDLTFGKFGCRGGTEGPCGSARPVWAPCENARRQRKNNYVPLRGMKKWREVDGVNHHEINGEYFSSALSLLIHTRQVDISVGHREHLRVSLLSYSSRVSSANVHCISGLKKRSPQNIFPTTQSFSKMCRNGLAHTTHYTPSCYLSAVHLQKWTIGQQALKIFSAQHYPSPKS